jgi:hypothetical protein
MHASNDHPYRPLFAADQPARPRASALDLQIACAVLVAFSAIQLATGTQTLVGAAGIAGGLAALCSTWRASWTTSSSCS